MRHRNRRGKLGRKSEHRMMMLRNMAISLFDRERIQTTLPRAKELRPFAEKLITLARRQNLEARRKTLQYIHDKRVVRKLFDDIALRFGEGNGGYTRIIPYRTRWGDGASTAFIELTKPKVEEKPEKKGRKAKAADSEAAKAKSEKKESKAAGKETAQEKSRQRKGRKKAAKEEEKD